MPARALLSSASFMNFLQWASPDGFRHLRSGWDAANDTWVMDLWRGGKKRAEYRYAVAEDLRNDMLWRWQLSDARPTNKLNYRNGDWFAWTPRLPQLRQGAMGQVCTDDSATGYYVCRPWACWQLPQLRLRRVRRRFGFPWLGGLLG